MINSNDAILENEDAFRTFDVHRNLTIIAFVEIAIKAYRRPIGQRMVEEFSVPCAAEYRQFLRRNFASVQYQNSHSRNALRDF
jgi:hypothetical protein